MLARRLTTILPAMTLAEAIETTRIHRVAGLHTPMTSALLPPCMPLRHVARGLVMIGSPSSGKTILDQLPAHELILEVGVIYRGRD